MDCYIEKHPSKGICIDHGAIFLINLIIYISDYTCNFRYFTKLCIIESVLGFFRETEKIDVNIDRKRCILMNWITGLWRMASLKFQGRPERRSPGRADVTVQV